MKTLQCSCCGSGTKGKQHWNQDTGYGLCPKCVSWIIGRSSLDEVKRSHGKPGVNFAMPLSAECEPGMLVGWKTRNEGETWDIWHIGKLKRFGNGVAIITEINDLDERHEVTVACDYATDTQLFIGVFPAGISYADRTKEEDGDYKKIAFLPYRSLELEIHAPRSELLPQIKEHAATIQARRGELFEVSTCGQTVKLGG
jgi:hypothetical protein